MKYSLLISLVTISVSTQLSAKTKLKSEFNLEVNTQVKSVTNTAESKKLGNDWNSENIHTVYGNVFGRFAFKDFSLDYNWFIRYAESELYKVDEDAALFTTAPNSSIKRDVLKLSKVDTSERSRTESSLNRFALEWGDEETKFRAGRMFIEYGNGQTFNPINPFSAQLVFSDSQDLRQGNDGLQFYISTADDFKFHFYVLSDTQFFGDDSLTRTVMLRGDWQYSKNLHINYIIGEDQKRHKYGGEISYDLSGSKSYIQAVRQSQRLDKSEEDEEGLFHYLLGYQKEFTNKLTTSIEVGKYQISEIYPEGEYQSNILPISAFAAMLNRYQFNDKNTVDLKFMTDTESKFSYYHLSYGYKATKRIDISVFGSGRASKAESRPKYASQNSLPTQVGLNFRAAF
jgi:hypothetical protein